MVVTQIDKPDMCEGGCFIQWIG